MMNISKKTLLILFLVQAIFIFLGSIGKMLHWTIVANILLVCGIALGFVFFILLIIFLWQCLPNSTKEIKDKENCKI